MVKEHKFPKESFIGGWYINPNNCDALIDLFKKNSNLHKEGVIGGPYNINKNNKDSIDLGIHPEYTDPAFVEYKKSLKECVKEYEKLYPELQNFNAYGMQEGANIQYYKPSGGFKKWHSERGSLLDATRVLVFMTFLNNATGGGTMFKYQKLTIPAKKGLTLIWPTDFTHTHKGQISKTHEKYIITGWYSFNG